MATSLVVGFGLGFLVAVQVGPMTLLLVRSTLRSGLAVGLAVGVGIAAVDTLYATAGALGAASLLLLEPVRFAVGVLGAAVLVWLGGRTLLAALHVRADLEPAHAVSTPRAALLTSLGATASNPLTIASWAAVFGAASAVAPSSPLLLVAGVGLGSAVWVVLLALGVAAVRRSLSPRVVRAVDGVSGAGLIGFGALLGVRAVD